MSEASIIISECGEIETTGLLKTEDQLPVLLYDNEYTLIIDIYFYEYFLWSQTLSACASNILDTLSDILDKCLRFFLIKIVCLNLPSQAMLGSFLLICCIYFPIKIVLIKN